MIGKVCIPRKNWYRENSAISTLLVSEYPRKQCCVGIMLTQFGLSDNDIGKNAKATWSMISHIRRTLRLGEFAADCRLGIVDSVAPSWVKSNAVNHALDVAYRINDDEDKTDQFKEREIAEQFALFGLKTIFFDEEINFQV